MNTYSIEDLVKSTDRHKLYTLLCRQEELSDCIAFLNAQKINPVNVGKELAAFINGLEDYSYMNIDVLDYIKRLLDEHKSKINKTGNDVVAIYNLGILLEPALQLNAVQLLKDFAKTVAIIIIWENGSIQSDRLQWPTQQSSRYFDFTETPLKSIDYAL